MERDELQAWLRLTLSPGVGNETARKLLATFGSAQAVFEQSASTLNHLGTDKLSRAIQEVPPTLADLLQTTLDWLAAADNRKIVTLGDAGYPAGLLDIADPPLMLYMMGVLAKRAQSAINNIANPAQPQLAIVGSRNPTPQGEVNARQFARTFGASGLCIVSGLALGVDGAAHDGAMLGGGNTIAVVGTGLDRVYPKKHLELAHRIAAQGMIVSEFPLGTPPLTENFPKRNRIISGLAQGTLVVEAALASGSLITARCAADMGRDVFAIPGSIHSTQAKGCHALIRQGAKLVETAQDVLEELRFTGGSQARKPTNAPADPFADEADSADESVVAADRSGQPVDAVLDCMGHTPVGLDAIQARTGMSTAALQAHLLDLELDGHLARMPGGLFQRIVRA